jgi:hypothetical protein
MSAFAEDPPRENDNEEEYDEEEDYDEEEIDTDWVFSSVKRPVDIYLPDEDKWFAGTLLRVVDAIERLALVSYDDEDFADETIPFEDLRPGQLPSKKRQKEKKAAEKRLAAAAAAAAGQSSNANNTLSLVNEVKFKRYLTDVILGEEFVPSNWQPCLEKACPELIDQLIARLSVLAANGTNLAKADLQEFDRSLHQSKVQQDCYLYRDDSYLIAVPLHLPPLNHTSGTYVNKKEQEKQAAARQTQLRMGAFILKKDASEILGVLSDDEYMEMLGIASANHEAVVPVKLLDIASATGGMPLPIKEPHNESNKISVVIPRILHALDQWNATHHGEELLELFCCSIKSDSSEDASNDTDTASVSPGSKVAREDILQRALQTQCHRLSITQVFTSTCTFSVPVTGGTCGALQDAQRTRCSFTEWQDLMRRQRAHSVGDGSTAASVASGSNKVRSDSVISILSEKDSVSGKSRSGSIVTEKDAADAYQKSHHSTHKSPRTPAAITLLAAEPEESGKQVKRNSRAARRAAAEDEDDSEKLDENNDKRASVDEGNSFEDESHKKKSLSNARTQQKHNNKKNCGK